MEEIFGLSKKWMQEHSGYYTLQEIYQQPETWLQTFSQIQEERKAIQAFLEPIPGLDGSQVLFALIERIVGKEIPVKWKYVVQLAGLSLLFGLMIFVTINDITKFFK